MGWCGSSVTGFNWVLPTTAQFMAQFFRDFPYAPSTDPNNLNYVTSQDITNAITEANINFNPALGFPDLTSAQTAFLYLSAFYLAYNLQTALKGVSSGSSFPLQSSSVGSVSTSFAIPEKYMRDPYINMLAQNRYGMTYLSMVLPYLRGNINSAWGTTTAT